MKEFKVNVNPMIKKLEIISKKGISGLLSGEFRSAFKGSGLEFRGFRVYNPGEDDAKNIDWKASLRSKNLLVKELVEERNNNVVFLVDVSSSMSFGSEDKLKNEYVIEMFASMAYSLIKGGDSVGLSLFSDRVVKSITPNIGNRQYYMLLKMLTDTENYEGKKDFKKVLHDMNALLARPAIIVIISDFIGMSDDWYEEFKFMSAKHELIVFVVNDPRDVSLPQEVGQVFVTDPFTGDDLLIDTKLVKEQYERYVTAQSESLSKFLKNLAVDHQFIKTDQPFNRVLYTFFKMRTVT